MEISFLNLAIISSLVPFCTGLVQLLKNDKLPPYAVKLLSLVVGLGLAFLIRNAEVDGFSEVLSNPYLTILTGIAIGLTASGLFGMVQPDNPKR